MTKIEPNLTSSEEKLRIECDKLRAEIKAIGKPLLQTPGFYSAIGPVAMMNLGLVFTWSWTKTVHGEFGFNKRTGRRILQRGLVDYEGLETCDIALGRDGNKRTGRRIIGRRFVDCEVLTTWEARISINDRRSQNKS